MAGGGTPESFHPDVVAAETAQDMRAAMAQFEEIFGDLSVRGAP